MFGSRFYAPHFAPQQRQKYQRPQQEPNFQGLFRLIDDWDRYAQQTSSSPACRQTITKAFTPKFDVRETETAYELHGELPGIEKENVHIEFTDPQTIRIRGRVDRSYTAGTTPAPPAGLLEQEEDDNNATILHDQIPHDGEEHQQQQEQEIEDDDDFEAVQAEPEAAAADDHHSETSSHKSFQATVEDENEDGTTSPIPTPATTTTTAAASAPVVLPAAAAPKKQAEEVQRKPQQPQQPKNNNNKFWVSERSVGEFTRLFTFPTRVEAESVVAGLRDGILTVSVPKARRHETRRIVIF